MEASVNVNIAAVILKIYFTVRSGFVTQTHRQIHTHALKGRKQMESMDLAYSFSFNMFRCSIDISFGVFILFAFAPI